MGTSEQPHGQVEGHELESREEVSPPAEEVEDSEADIEAFLIAYRAMKSLSPVARERAYRWLGDKLNLRTQHTLARSPAGDQTTDHSLRERADTGRVPASGVEAFEAPAAQPAPSRAAQTLTPQAFIAAKKPMSLNERVACLAYYLAHYRDASSFRPVEIDTLNVEARQPRIGNSRSALDNATRDQYLHIAAAGEKGLTTRGEAVVNALPDREAVAKALEEHPLTRTRKRTKGAKANKQSARKAPK